MAAPHNKQRYGETWPEDRIKACLENLRAIKGQVILSGGWAWHFMSPAGHVELKHSHDHKDIDVFVRPHDVTSVILALTLDGFKKVPTRYDGLTNNKDFRRYEKMSGPHKITIDFFVDGNVPVREINGWKIVEPSYLLSLYKTIHSSDTCFAVQAAAKLIKKGIDPVGREELVQIPKGN